MRYELQNLRLTEGEDRKLAAGPIYAKLRKGLRGSEKKKVVPSINIVA
jgi:hypothetical protein